MKPETRRAFNGVMAAHWYAAKPGGPTECEAAFLGGMMEAARLCREYAATTSPVRGIQCAELIESSVKGE